MEPFFFFTFIVINHVLEINKVKKTIRHEHVGEKIFVCNGRIV